ncbi:MAG: TusE/DsrC/DsvC family sulfur relay protein [Sulfurisoma sp.]|nr:TusE/DsrC/DsvC family sulfur relay protein [Sulfurisoma sp.]
MLDINKFAANQRLAESDPDGHLYSLDHWSPVVAGRIAREEGLVLDDDHWLVIFYLRQHFREHGASASAGTLLRELEHTLFDHADRRRLYELFPRGPIAQASRIAGLPLPKGTLDPSFGSSH